MFSYVKEILSEKYYTVANMEGPLAILCQARQTERAGQGYPLLDQDPRGWRRVNYAHEKMISIVADPYNVEYELVGGWYQIKLP